MNINILTIIGKHSPLLEVAIKYNIPTEVNPENVKAAIKEIVETVISKCAERVQFGSVEDADEYMQCIDSILNVKTMIDYGTD